MSASEERRGVMVVTAGMVMMIVLGSVHAFSVFLEPLENRFAVSRGETSLTYSLALVSLTISVLFAHHVFRRVRAVPLMILVGGLAAGGCLLAAHANSLAMVWLGYGVLFGAANGLGYAYALQGSAQANPERAGFAMGLITACYALGAVLAPLPFDILIKHSGFEGAMVGLGGAIVIVMPVAAFLLHKSGAVLRVDEPAVDDVDTPVTLGRDGGRILILWLGYGTAVTAGLMAIGHAAGIARAGGLSSGGVLAAPVVIAVFNLGGSLLGGWFADRMALNRVLFAVAALSSVALFAMALTSGALSILAGLAIVGFGYGATIAVYPAAVASVFGAVRGVKAYGYIFTAWGTAGLAGPALAGYLFGQSGSYTVPLMVAGVAGLVSCLTVRFLPERSP